MPIDDTPFYNILGEEISRNGLVNEMIKYYNLKLGVGETKVTDFNEGSEIRNLLEAIAVDLYVLLENVNEVSKVAFIETATGEWLDKHGADPRINLPRSMGTEAEGIVTFSITNERDTDLIIPEATTVTSVENGLDYITDIEAVIPVGETETSVGATCLTVGEDGNCSKETITIINDDYFYDPELRVINNNAFENGTEYEEDEEYRQKLLNYIRIDDFGSVPYYQNLGASVNGVHDVKLVDDETYTSKVLVNGNVKPVTDSVLNDVLYTFTDTSNIVMGHSFIVDAPDYLTVDLSIDLTVSSKINEDNITEALHGFVDGGAVLDGLEYDGLNIGQGFSNVDIINLLMVYNSLISATVTYNNESNFVITPDTDEVIKLGTLTINQTVEE